MRAETLTALLPLPDAAFRLLTAAFALADSKGRAPAAWGWWAERAWSPAAPEGVARAALRTLADRGELATYRGADLWYAVFPRVALERAGKHPPSLLPGPTREALAAALQAWPDREALISELMDDHPWTIREREVTRRSGGAVEPTKAAVKTDDAYRVIREWVRATDREPGRIFGDNMTLRRNRANSKRYALARKAIEEYGLTTVLAAVRGVTLSPHNMGENKTGMEYTDLTLILKDGEHIERFATLSERSGGSP